MLREFQRQVHHPAEKILALESVFGRRLGRLRWIEEAGDRIDDGRQKSAD
jgi:hypothetical protein